MIELKLDISDVDYEALIKAFAGSLSGPAILAAKALPDSAKEDLAVKYLNTNANKLCAALEKMASGKGIHLSATGAEAKKL